MQMHDPTTPSRNSGIPRRNWPRKPRYSRQKQCLKPMHFAAASILMAIFEAAGVGFTNGDQPGVRLATAAIAAQQNPSAGQNQPMPRQRAAAKPPRRPE